MDVATDRKSVRGMNRRRRNSTTCSRTCFDVEYGIEGTGHAGAEMLYVVGALDVHGRADGVVGGRGCVGAGLYGGGDEGSVGARGDGC